MKEICDWMNEHQLKNPRGNPMTYNTVEHMLKNRRYIGEEKFRDNSGRDKRFDYRMLRGAKIKPIDSFDWFYFFIC